MPRPNVLFLFTDDQRFDTIGALGNPAVRTPNFDRLAARGVAFTHAHIPGGTSGAVCMPSRAMLHTGRSLFHITEAGQRIDPAHTTLGEAFQGAGYRTAGFGKWHNGKASFARSFTDGDEIFFGGMCDHWNVPAYHFDPEGRYDATLKSCPDPMRSNMVRERGCDHIHAGRHSSELLADAAIAFLDRAGDDPFLAYVAFLAPHDPRTMPQTFRELHDPETIELPPNFMPGHPFNNGALHIRDEELAAFPRDPDEVRRHIAEYYGMISHLDAQIGRILDALDASGKRDNTIVVLAGDNGLAVGQHGLMGKQSNYEHSIRVPLIFAGPGVPANQRRDAYVYLFDVYPTLCELCGIEPPGSVEGTSLVKAIDDPAETVRKTLFAAYCGQQRSVKDRRYKLIEYVVDGRHTRTQLFDLQQDPWERENLADTPDHAPTRRRLSAEMARWRDLWDDARTPWGEAFWTHCG